MECFSLLDIPPTHPSHQHGEKSHGSNARRVLIGGRILDIELGGVGWRWVPYGDAFFKENDVA